jgi:nucleoside-diphosphate-sugar epimerase
VRVFLTGAGSFIGREFLRLCDAGGLTVTGIDLVPVDRNDCHVADIRSPGIADLVPEGVDALVHLAALSRDADCRGKAYECFDINVMGTLNMVEAAAKKDAKQFIYASTEWVYDHFEEGVAKTEDDPIEIANLTSEYALSKLVGEANLRQRFQHGFCAVTILRFGIVYGPRAENWGAVESLLNAVATQDEVTVGALATARHFIHVADIAAAILCAVGLQGFEIINIQGEKLITLAEVITNSKLLLNRDPQVRELNPEKPSIRLVANEKAKIMLDWQPRVDFETGLQTVIDFLGLMTLKTEN